MLKDGTAKQNIWFSTYFASYLVPRASSVFSLRLEQPGNYSTDYRQFAPYPCTTAK
jgi:hypothetical protein